MLLGCGEPERERESESVGLYCHDLVHQHDHQLP